MADDWRARRSEDVAARAAAADRERAAEAARAQVLIDAFVAEATRRGIAPEPLTAHGRDGRGRYRTGIVGWYLKADETVGIDVDGRFYLLWTQGGLRERLRGTVLKAGEPPLVVGKGARDGESLELSLLLDRRLQAG